METRLFKKRNGIIPACDVNNIQKLGTLVEETYDIDGIVGYKIGSILTLKYGLRKIVDRIRAITDFPIIYDHQKGGTDIPEISSGAFLNICKEAEVNAIIIFPLSGIKTLRMIVANCKEIGLIPIVGGEMTHKGYLSSEGGYLSVDAPERIYKDAGSLGVKHFVIPGTKIKSIEKYSSLLAKTVHNPEFLFPGVGKGQGGDIISAFKATKLYASYAIVGRGIYAEKDMKGAAKNLLKNIGGQID